MRKSHSSRSSSPKRWRTANRPSSSSALQKTGKIAKGRADTIDYDAAKGIVRLTEECLAQRRAERDSRRVAQVQRARAKHRRGRRGAGLPASAHHHHAAAHQTMSVLRALNLAKSYKSRQILRDLSLEVESGEVVGLLGPNGAGKTTAFYMIVGLTRLEHGEIYPRQPRHRPPAHAPPRPARVGLPAAGALGLSPHVGVEQHHGHPRDPSGPR